MGRTRTLEEIRCDQTGPCFARQMRWGNPACTLLAKSFKDQICPFQKDDPEYTDGKYYPFNTEKYGEPLSRCK